MRVFYLILMLGMGGCSQPPDLDTPCPNFGQHCPQQPLNDESPLT